MLINPITILPLWRVEKTQGLFDDIFDFEAALGRTFDAAKRAELFLHLPPAFNAYGQHAIFAKFAP